MKKSRAHLWVLFTTSACLTVIVSLALTAPFQKANHSFCQSDAQICYMKPISMHQMFP